MRTLIGISSVVMAVACGTTETTPRSPGAPDVVDLTIELALPTSGYQLVTEPMVVEPGTERLLCSVVRVTPEADELLFWVNRMESMSSDDSHHMNVYFGDFSFFEPFLGPEAVTAALGVEPGTYDCDVLDGLMELAVPFFPSQRTNQRITLPEGVAIPMMAPMTLVMEHHYINIGDAPVRINAALNLERTPVEEVDEVASLVFDAIRDLEVPAETQKVESRTCIFDREVEVALVSTHTHQWAQCASINHYDGQADQVEADPFFVNKYWHVPPILHFERDTFTVAPGNGVHYACHYDNNSTRVLVDDGTAQGEMCVFAAVVYPAPVTVPEVEEVMASGGLTELLAMLEDVVTPCDRQLQTATPWSAAPPTEDACDGFDQTESNEL
jgi:hypothetical protein